MTNFTIPGGRSLGNTGHTGDHNLITAAIAAIAGVNVLNAAYAGGADPTGVADSTAAFTAALAVGGLVYAPPGNYLLNSTALPMAVGGTVLRGAGPGATKLTIGASFSGAELINITASDCGVSALEISGTLNGASQVNGIEVTAAQRGRFSDLYFTGVNGWCIETISTSGTFCADQMFRSLTGRSCAGGIHVKGYAAGGSHAENFLTDMQFQEMGAASGGAVGLDVFLFEDCHDITGLNFNVGFSGSAATPGAALHLHGSAGSSLFTNMDLGAGAESILIDDGSGGSVFGIDFVNYLGGQVVISGGCHRIKFSSSAFTGSGTHGVTVSSTGFGIDFIGCDWYGNGAGASGNNYDLNWSGVANGAVRDCVFESTPVAMGTAGVQANVAISSGRNVIFDGNIMPDSSAAFTNQPRYVRTPVTAGLATLAAGTVAVAASLTSAQSRIRLAAHSIGGTPGAVYVSAITPGTGFTITSTNGADTSVIAWEITT